MKFELKIENGDKLSQLLNNMSVVDKNKELEIILKEAANIEIQQIKTNFIGKVKHSYKSSVFNSAFIINITNKGNVVFGIGGNDGYIYRWNQWGTKLRQTGGKTRGSDFRPKKSKQTDSIGRKAHSTGVMSQKNFFYEGVQQSNEKAFEILSNGIVEIYNQIVNNNNK